MTALILARYPLRPRLAAACDAAGLSVVLHGGFGPGEKAAVLLDLPAFATLVEAHDRRLRFGREPGDPVVLVVDRLRAFREVGAIVRAGAIPVGEGEIALLPEILRRLAPALAGEHDVEALPAAA
jgi:hypothetical protein